MKMVNPKLLDPYSKEFKILCSAAAAELRGTGIIRDRVDARMEIQKMSIRGVDLVDWMMANAYCETKLHATQIGDTMLQTGIIIPSTARDTFLGDSATLYRIKESQASRLRKVGSKLFGRSNSVSPQSLMDSNFDEVDKSLDRNGHSHPRCSGLLRPANQDGPENCVAQQNNRRSSMEIVVGFVPGLEDRQSRKILKANTRMNRSQISRQTQLRVLVSSMGVSEDISETSDPLPVECIYDLSFPEVGFERGRSKISFSDTIHVREIARDPKEDAKKKPKEYQRFMDPEEEEPAAYQFSGMDSIPKSSFSIS